MGDTRRLGAIPGAKLAMLVFLVLSGVYPVAAGNAWPDGRPVEAPSDNVSKVSLMQRDGLIHGRLEGQTLNAVLAELEAMGLIQVRATAGVPDYPVYGEFVGVTLADLFREILAPLNYALMLRGDDEPQKLIVMGLSDSASPSPAGTRAGDGSSSSSVTGDGVSERMGLSEGGEPGLVPMPESFGASTVSEETRLSGPGGDAGEPDRLPWFVPTTQPKGPVVPGNDGKPFPRHEPISLDGPPGAQ